MDSRTTSWPGLSALETASVAAAAGRRGLGQLHVDALVVLPRALERPADERSHVLDVEGLEYVVEGAALHRLDGRLGGAVGVNDDDRHPRRDALDLVERFEPAHHGHPHIHDDDVGRIAARLLDRLARPTAAFVHETLGTTETT